jgi:DNA polymerase-1
MNSNRIASMPVHAVAFDCETWLIQDGLLAPPLVCASLARAGTGTATLVGKEDALRVFEGLLDDRDVVIVGANIAFDMLVMAVHGQRQGVDLVERIFAAYADGRVFDVQIAEKLHAIAQGHLGLDPRTRLGLRSPSTGKEAGYSLEVVTDLVLGRTDAKVNDTWRLRYAELDEVPLDEWPEEARVYPVDDVRNTLEVALAQAGHAPNVGVHLWTGAECGLCRGDIGNPPERCVSTYRRRNLHDLAHQVYKLWCLHLGAAWGRRANQARVDVLEAAALAGRNAGEAQFKALGFIRPDGTEDTAVLKRAVAVAFGATETCVTCSGSGKVHNKFSKKDPTRPVGAPVQCKPCGATGVVLEGTVVPVTEKGNVQAGRDILVDSGDETLMAYASLAEDNKVLETYVPYLRRMPNARPNSPLETGRVSYSGADQTLPRMVSAHLAEALRDREPRVHGVRDCIEARPGYMFYSNDYSGGELVTLAESCLTRVGQSKLGEFLVTGKDAHAALGANMMGVTYDQLAAWRKQKATPEGMRATAFRQGAKKGNFGFGGGMAELKFTIANRKDYEDTPCPNGPSLIWDGTRWVQGYKGMRFCVLIAGAERCGVEKITEYKGRPTIPVCRRCVEVSASIRADWFRTWPEMRPYLEWHAANADDLGYVVLHYSGRIRGGIEYTSGANGDFQALLADIAGRAQCRVSHEQYVKQRVVTQYHPGFKASRFEGQESPLFGSRSITFQHDELTGEAPESVAAEVSERVNEIMVEEFKKGCPNHAAACKAEPTLMRRLYKQAEPVYENGRLVPWEPKA